MRALRLALTFAAVLFAAPAHAHTMSVAHVDATTQPGGAVRLEADLALRDIALTLSLDANRDERVTWGELQAVAPQLQSLVAERIELARGGQPCQIAPVALGTRRYDDGMYATITMQGRCAARGALSLRYGLFFDRDPRHRALVTLREAGTVSGGIARAQARTVSGRDGDAAPFAAFVREGVHHILVGYDHLAFLVSLLLTAALVREGGGWSPASGVRASLGRVLGIVTAFTVAHSATLALAAMGLVTPASRWVESAIAGSVVIAALNNVWPWTTRRTWVLGFGFGLVHGFGFAGALAELGLPQGQRLAWLFGFNLGVELGQLSVVACLLPVLYGLRGTRWYPRAAMPLASLSLAGVAGIWMVQRLGA